MKKGWANPKETEELIDIGEKGNKLREINIKIRKEAK